MRKPVRAIKNKILILSNMYPSDNYPTFGIFVKKQVDQLEERGWVSNIISIRDPRTDKFHVLKKYFLWMLKAFFHILFKGNWYKVVHVHYVFPAGIFGLMAKRLWKRRLIVTVHGGDIDKMARKSERIFNLTRTILHEADQVICVGYGLYQDLLNDFHVKEDKISMLSMGVDQNTFQVRDKQAIKKKLDVPEDEKIILFVGNIIKEKGVLELLEAFQGIYQNNSKVRLHIVGPYKNKSFFDQVQEKIKRLDIEEQVVFHGVLSPEEVAYWMNASEMLVLPSWMEGFGLVALEAMSSGIPVVGSDVGGLSILLGDNCGVKFPVKNSDQLANSITNILNDDKRADQLIENGLHRAREHNSDTLLNKVISIYKGESIDEKQTQTQ
ncbi:glycosyltransferase [Aquibacillus rhizosphaerae]|uniref:Glycosyltransferase n=1 Tax=Aquibacillus rhizosphaerae TaxID=3051431 RepID=A0ABT7KZJ8_9BACI|nr:glycosyltransferase [Aquibacillus sp. LR5S19]MDL4838888.1 glycosyltransferase [Aquibacillus sp. LR5S19]